MAGASANLWRSGGGWSSPEGSEADTDIMAQDRPKQKLDGERERKERPHETLAPPRSSTEFPMSVILN